MNSQARGQWRVCSNGRRGGSRHGRRFQVHTFKPGRAARATGHVRNAFLVGAKLLRIEGRGSVIRDGIERPLDRQFVYYAHDCDHGCTRGHTSETLGVIRASPCPPDAPSARRAPQGDSWPPPVPPSEREPGHGPPRSVDPPLLARIVQRVHPPPESLPPSPEIPSSRWRSGRPLRPLSSVSSTWSLKHLRPSTQPDGLERPATEPNHHIARLVLLHRDSAFPCRRDRA